jgi:prepilin-type N-terminal cleavage/methylation domain-containing protein
MSRPRGFTLIEVLVALTVGAMVVASAHQLLAASAELAERSEASRLANTRTANARRFLVMAVANTAITGSDADRFDGSDSALTLTTWLPSASGYLERSRLSVMAGGGYLLALTDTDTVTLVVDVATSRFDYLLSYGAQAAWEREWRSAVTAPVAIRLRIGRIEPVGRVDTLLLAVGPRG